MPSLLPLAALLAVLAAPPENSSTPVPPPEASQFEFLIGTWDVVEEPNLPGVPEKVQGRWTAQRAADGFMVVDEFRISDGEGGTAYLGETYRVYNPSAKRWEFRFVEPYSGTWHEGTAVKVGDEMHLTQGSPAGGSMAKIRYYNISRDHFSWISQRSRDGGKTWTPGAKIEATRVK
jgi:hypothetical protein